MKNTSRFQHSTGTAPKSTCQGDKMVGFSVTCSKKETLQTLL